MSNIHASITVCSLLFRILEARKLRKGKRLMKKWILLLTAAALCLCMAACVKKSADTPAGTTDAPSQTTAPTQTTADGGNEPGEIAVSTPDEMPDAPTADYSLPGNERPGDRVTDVPKS